MNGEQAEIVAITGTRVRLRTTDGSTLSLKHEDPQLRHIDHAWSSTVHGAQGSTADGVIAVLDSGHGLLTDQATFYVEISRARDSVMVLTDNGEQLIETLEANTGERATALEAVGVTPDELRASLPEKTMPRRPREETLAPEARHEDAAGALVADGHSPTEETGDGEGREAGDPRHDIEAAARRDAVIAAFDAAWRSVEDAPADRPPADAPGYHQLLESARALLEDPDLPAAVRKRAAALVEADTAWRLTDARIEELHREADHLLHVRRDLAEAAGEARPVAETAGYADWIAAVATVETAWQEISSAPDFRPILTARSKSVGAIVACLATCRDARTSDDACARFETLRRAVHERAAAGNTIGFHVDGHDDLVRQAQLLAAMKNVPEHVRSSARAAIAHEAQARDRQGRVLALAEEAGRLLDGHRRLTAEAPERPAAELAGYRAWRERWLKARRQWRAMCKRPDLWQPHLDRDAGDVAERLGRCERRALTDEAWARFAVAHRRVHARSQAQERIPFGMVGWHGLVTQARALLLRDGLPDAAAVEARGVLASDAEGRACRDAIGRFLADAREHTRRWRILGAEARDRSRHGRDTVITDLEGYRPLAAFARELEATGRALLGDERYGPHLDHDPATAGRISRALEKLERHRPFDRFLEVTRNLKALRRRARRDGVPAFHSEGYGAVFDDVRELAGDRDLPAAARRRLKPVIEEHADCADECARIEARVKEMAGLDREHRTIREAARQDNVPITLLDGWPRWLEKAAAWRDGTQELLDLGRFARHLSCQPALQERIETGLADVAERLAAPDRDRIRIAAMVREQIARLHGRPPGGAFAIAWRGQSQLVTGDRLRRRLAHDGSVQELVVVWPGVSGGRNGKDTLLVERVGTERNGSGSWKGRVERVACRDLARDRVHRATWSDERLRDAVAARERSAPDSVHRSACHWKVVAGDRLRWTMMPEPSTGTPGHDAIDPGVAVEPRYCEGVLLRIVAGKTQAEDLCTLQVLRVNGRENVHDVEMERRQLVGRDCYRAPWADEEERSDRLIEQTDDLRERRRILHRRGPHLSM